MPFAITRFYMAKPKKTVRLNLRMSEEDEKRIHQLMQLSGAASMTDVVRRSLAVYEHLWQEKRRRKKRIVIRDKDGEELDFLLL